MRRREARGGSLVSSPAKSSIRIVLKAVLDMEDPSLCSTHRAPVLEYKDCDNLDISIYDSVMVELDGWIEFDGSA